MVQLWLDEYAVVMEERRREKWMTPAEEWRARRAVVGGWFRSLWEALTATRRRKALCVVASLLLADQILLRVFDFNVIYLVFKDPNPPIVWQALATEDYADQGSDFLRGLDHYNREEFAAALATWRPLAEGGHAEAQYLIGRMYDFGWGVEQDYQDAAVLFRSAAALGHARAHSSLGYLHDQGWGVDRDHKKACDFYRESMNLGDRWGKWAYAICLERYHGADDLDAAVALLHELADMNYCRAYRSLAGLYGWEERGYRVDKARAYRFYKLAERGGCDHEFHRFLIKFTMSPETVLQIDSEF